MTKPAMMDLLGFSADGLDLRLRLTGPVLKRLAQNVVVRCESLLDETSSEYLDYRELAKPFWHSRDGIFVVPPAMQMLAAAYLITGEIRFGAPAKETLLTIVRRALADKPSLAWGVKSTGWRSGPGHDKFLFAMGVWQTLEFCGDLFSASERDELAPFLRESLQISLDSLKEDSANITNNRGVRGILASALWGLLLEGFEPVQDLEAILKRAWIALEKHFYFAFDAQGAPYEGPAYAGNTLGSLALMAEVLRRQGRANLLLHRTLERHPSYLTYELIPGFSGVNNLNDSAHPSGSVSGCLFWMNRPGGEIIPWLAHELDLSPHRLALGNSMGNPALRDFLNFLIWWDESVPIRSPGDLCWPLSRCFPVRGVASHRTGWSSSDGLVSHFCGRQEVLCHRQGDQNHMSLYAFGDHLLVDAGYGDEHKDMAKSMNRWFGLTEAHNCVLIDGKNQRGVLEAQGWGEGEMTEFFTDRSGSRSTGDAASATGTDHRILQSLRRVSLHRDGPKPLTAVWDRNERDGMPFTTEILWHTHHENRWEPGADGWIIRAKQCDCHVFVFNLRHEPFEIVSESAFRRPRLRIRSESALSEYLTIFLPLPRGNNASCVLAESQKPGFIALDVAIADGVSFSLSVAKP